MVTYKYILSLLFEITLCLPLDWSIEMKLYEYFHQTTCLFVVDSSTNICIQNIIYVFLIRSTCFINEYFYLLQAPSSLCVKVLDFDTELCGLNPMSGLFPFLTLTHTQV